MYEDKSVPELPTDAPELPTDAPELPTDAPELPTVTFIPELGEAVGKVDAQTCPEEYPVQQKGE